LKIKTDRKRKVKKTKITKNDLLCHVEEAAGKEKKEAQKLRAKKGKKKTGETQKTNQKRSKEHSIRACRQKRINKEKDSNGLTGPWGVEGSREV